MHRLKITFTYSAASEAVNNDNAFFHIVQFDPQYNTIGSRGRSWPSQMHEVTYDFLVAHIKASQQSLGDKPKSVYIFLQTPHEVYTRKSYFLDNLVNKHPHLTN